MNQGYPRLLGDIGGTNARWAWQVQAGGELQDVQVHRCADYASLIASATEYLERSGHRAPVWAGIGVATPVLGDEVRMTNHPWVFSIAGLQRQLGMRRCLVVNDFAALAMSLTALRAGELRPLGGGAGVEGAPLALLGPGTGLGVSGLIPNGGSGERGWTAISGEGGHVTLAAADDEEAALLARLRGRFGHVSAERALSGPGLVNLYQAHCELRGVQSAPLTPSQVSQAAVDATDASCIEAVRIFTSLLGSVAANLVLTLGARGGVYIGGGIVPRLGAAFDTALFRRRFEDKGRFATYLREVPARLITAPYPALLGATRALDLVPA